MWIIKVVLGMYWRLQLDVRGNILILSKFINELEQTTLVTDIYGTKITSEQKYNKCFCRYQYFSMGDKSLMKNILMIVSILTASLYADPFCVRNRKYGSKNS